MTCNLQKQIENTASYSDLRAMPTVDNCERMVSLCEAGVQMAFYTEVLPRSTGWDMFARESVALKLQSVSLPKGLNLEVTHAYRSPAIQEQKFTGQLKRFAAESDKATSQEAWIDAAHAMIASPDVAGHPTGGAIDVWITNCRGNPIDMGTDMHELSEASRVFNMNALSDEQFKNRMILREAMIDMGFTPYDGEWWHFSYGDKEWAYFSSKEEACYAPIILDPKTETYNYYVPPKPSDIIRRCLAA